VVKAEAELLRAASHEVVQWQAQNPQGTSGAVAALALSPWNFPAARSLGRVATRLRPHVAHVHNTWFAMSPSVLPALRRAGVTVVMTLHNYRLLCANGRCSGTVGHARTASAHIRGMACATDAIGTPPCNRCRRPARSPSTVFWAHGVGR
jgi:hypothetical protein